jgi:hypothetical protein
VQLYIPAVKQLRKSNHKMRKFLDNLPIYIAFFLFFWFGLSNIVFAFRHPWATSTERLIWTKEALFFEKVPYNKMRPRED